MDKWKKILEKIGLLGIILAVGGAIAYSVGVIDLRTLEIVLGVAGISGIAGLRTLIASSGYKSYIIAGGGVLVVIGVATEVVTTETAPILMGILGICGLGSLNHAVKKTGKRHGND